MHAENQVSWVPDSTKQAPAPAVSLLVSILRSKLSQGLVLGTRDPDRCRKIPGPITAREKDTIGKPSPLLVASASGETKGEDGCIQASPQDGG